MRSLLDREQHRLDALRSPARAGPARTSMLDQRAAEVAALRDRAGRMPATTGSTAADERPAAHAGPAARALPGGDAGARVRDRAARRRPRACAPRPTSRRATTLRVRLAERRADGDGRVTHHDRDDEAELRAGPHRAGRVVEQLEAGGSTLEESLALWERGEKLADVCQRWLDGARARLDAARPTRA